MRGCGGLFYNMSLLMDGEDKRELFEHLYNKSNEYLMDSFDIGDIQHQVLEFSRNIYRWNAYLLACEFFGEMANYSKNDIKMLRRLSM